MRRLLILAALAVPLLPARLDAQFVQGHVFVADYGADLVFEVDPTDWSFTTFLDASDGISGPSAIAFTGAGTMLVANYKSDAVLEVDALGNATTVLDRSDGIDGPFGENGIAIDGQGNVYVACFASQQILRFDQAYGNGTVFADGNDGVVRPDGLGFTASGDLLVANRGGGGTVLQIDAAGTTTTFDTITGQDVFSLAIRDNGDVYIGCSSGDVYRYPGGVAANRVRFGTWGGQNTPIGFSPDFQTLIHANYADGSVRTIDPDTAADAVVIAQGWGATGVGVFALRGPGWSNYGQGLPGTLGVPAFVASNPPVLGQPITLTADNSEGTRRIGGFLVVGTDKVQLPGNWGGDLLVLPDLWVRPVAIPVPELVLGGTLPNDPNMDGVSVYLQVLESDPGAVRGVSNTAGLQLRMGW